jgi:1,5-anhydro-D-fructose reductase (1,5-anhydro-D-mannitol-forming)
MRQLRFGVVGIGRIVEGTMAPAMVAEPEIELVAATSRDQGRADAFAEKFGARYAYTDFEEMVANPEVDAVYIATPNAQHYEQVLAAAKAGKHVFCDKPMGISAAEGRAEVEACQQAGVKLGINFHNRHLPWVRDAKQMIADGVIGDVTTIQVEAGAFVTPPKDWRNDPALAGLGTLYSQGVHVLDFMGYLLGSLPVEAGALFDNERGRYRVETEAMVLLRFANGTKAYMNCNQSNAYPQNDIAIYGTKGRIVGISVTRSRIDGELRVRTEQGETVTPYPSPGAHRLSLAAFAQAVLDGQTPNASGEDGLRSMELTDAIAQSVAEHRFVSMSY